MAHTIRQLMDALQGIEGEQEALDTRRSETEGELLGALCEYLPQDTDPDALVLGINHCTDPSNPAERCVYDSDAREECLFCGEAETIEDK